MAKYYYPPIKCAQKKDKNFVNKNPLQMPDNLVKSDSVRKPPRQKPELVSKPFFYAENEVSCAPKMAKI